MIYVIISKKGYCVTRMKDALKKAVEQLHTKNDFQQYECISEKEALKLLVRYAEDNDFIKPLEIKQQIICLWQPANTPKQRIYLDTPHQVSYYFNPNGKNFFAYDERHRHNFLPYDNDTNLIDENNPAIQKQLSLVGYVIFYDWKNDKQIYAYSKITSSTFIISEEKPRGDSIIVFKNC